MLFSLNFWLQSGCWLPTKSPGEQRARFITCIDCEVTTDMHSSPNLIFWGPNIVFSTCNHRILWLLPLAWPIDICDLQLQNGTKPKHVTLSVAQTSMILYTYLHCKPLQSAAFPENCTSFCNLLSTVVHSVFLFFLFICMVLVMPASRFFSFLIPSQGHAAVLPDGVIIFAPTRNSQDLF